MSVFLLALLAALILIIANTVTPTNRYMNSGAWGFTPTGGSLTNLTGVKSASYDQGISTKSESGDFDVLPTAMANDFMDPKITLEFLDAKAMTYGASGVPARGTLVGTVYDHFNKGTASGGGFTITFINSQMITASSSHPYRDFAKKSLAFGGISADGSTHPVSIAAL